MMSYRSFYCGGHVISLEAPELYVDNQARNRSGHMTHAMAEFAPGCFIDFNSNCSALRLYGHMPYGWVEYRISRDAGKTYSPIYDLEYSKTSFLDGIYAISVEKATALEDGTILAFCLRNDANAHGFCEPWFTPTVIRSFDEGKTWTEPVECIPYSGRIYDVRYHKGVIYVLIFCNERHKGTKPEHLYRIYKSEDKGESFQELAVVPFDTMGRAYGAMIFDKEDVLHVYAYNYDDEYRMDHVISRDFGKTWECLEPCYLPNGIRNPQVGCVDGVYILHGRAGDAAGFALYASEDATNWGKGIMVETRIKSYGCFYSNNLPLRDENGNFLLIQYSDIYEPWAKVNVKHMKLRVRPND